MSCGNTIVSKLFQIVCLPTHKMKEEKGKSVGDKKGVSS